MTTVSGAHSQAVGFEPLTVLAEGLRGLLCGSRIFSFIIRDIVKLFVSSVCFFFIGGELLLLFRLLAADNKTEALYESERADKHFICEEEFDQV